MLRCYASFLNKRINTGLFDLKLLKFVKSFEGNFNMLEVTFNTKRELRSLRRTVFLYVLMHNFGNYALVLASTKI